MKEVIEVKRDDLRELYQVLTNYPAISKEQVQNEMHKVFGEDTFKPKDIMERVKTFEDACRELGEEHPFVRSYNGYTNNIHENNKNDTDNKAVKVATFLSNKRMVIKEGKEYKINPDSHY